jgi:hypothetical protein
VIGFENGSPQPLQRRVSPPDVPFRKGFIAIISRLKGDDKVHYLITEGHMITMTMSMDDGRTWIPYDPARINFERHPSTAFRFVEGSQDSPTNEVEWLLPEITTAQIIEDDLET